jgi:hypothetical protein
MVLSENADAAVVFLSSATLRCCNIQHSKMHRIMAIRDEMKRKIIILKSGGKNALFI